MKAACRAACAVVIAAFAYFVSVAWAQSSATPSSTTISPLVLYDDFNGPRIDPSKWDDWTQSAGIREAVRELSPLYQGQINNGRLHIFQRAYSWTGNDDGASYGWLGLQFTNPSVVETSFTVAVNGATLSECQSNPSSSSSAWAGFVGRYFNFAGQQNDSQDVEAGIALFRESTDTGTSLRVQAHISSGDGTVNSYQTLGSVRLGQTAKLRVKWDQPNHQFVFQLNCNPAVSMSYNVSDTFPPVTQIKAFWVGQGTPNCTTKPPGSAMMDAYFDNVYVNAQ